MSFAFRTLALAAATVGLAACSNPTNSRQTDELARYADSDGIGGVYVLQSVNGAALPTVLVSHESYRMRVLADTFYLYADGTGGMAMGQAVLEGSTTTEIIRHETSAITHKLDANGFRASIPCDIQAFVSCLAEPHFVGQIDANSLVMTTALNYAGPLRFARVAGEPLVQRVRILAGSEVTIPRTGQTTLTAEVLDTSGTALSGERVSWQSFLPSVATVDAAGVVRPVAEGVAAVVAFAKGRTDTVRVVVTR